MEQQRSHTFSKAERLCSKKLIERLFGGEGKSFPAFPLRVVYMPLTEEEMAADVSILVSVPKKRFKRAVKRNRVKRQVREAYRRNKHILTEALAAQEGAPRMALAFIWLDGKLHPSVEVEQKVKKLLHHIAEDHR
jgi:ribonuclease P protein component